MVGIAEDRPGTDWVLDWLIANRGSFEAIVIQTNGAPVTSLLLNDIENAYLPDGRAAELPVIGVEGHRFVGGDRLCCSTGSGVAQDAASGPPGFGCCGDEAAVKVLGAGGWVIDRAKSVSDAAPLHRGDRGCVGGGDSRAGRRLRFVEVGAALMPGPNNLFVGSQTHGEARIREIVREELAAHKARKRAAGQQKWLKNLADLQNKFAEQNARFTAETGIEVKNPITDQQLTDLAAAFRGQREKGAASVGLLQGQNAPVQRPDISPQSPRTRGRCARL